VNIRFQFVLAIFVVFVLSACKQETKLEERVSLEVSEDSGAENLLVPSSAVEKHNETLENNSDEIEESDESSLADYPPNYLDIPKKGFPYPFINGKIISFLDLQVNEEKTAVIYTYDETDFKTQFEELLVKEGFLLKAENIYLRELKNNSIRIVSFFEYDGKLYITFSITRDPFGRYSNLPDSRIPYPLEDSVFAAKYNDFTVIEDIEAKFFQSGQEKLMKSVRYFYHNLQGIPKSIFLDYSKKLQETGFVKLATDEVKYCKQVDLETLELCVLINAKESIKNPDILSTFNITATLSRLAN